VTGGDSRDSSARDPVAALAADHERFRRFLEARTASREDAEDILQSAFATAVEKVDTIESAASVTAWFYRVLRRALVDHQRRQEAQRRALDARAAETTMTAGEDSALWDTVCACVGALLPALRPQEAQILRRVDLEGQSIGAIAVELGIDAGHARVRLHRARAALRRRVEDVCRTCAEHGCRDCRCRNAPPR
jgi:RNA polymerase sigma factor (sigma-70 family)